MKWNREIQSYQTVMEQDVVHFTDPASKKIAIETYNRAIRQIRQGNVDMAAISLKALATTYQTFVQAVQLAVCCQMMWHETKWATHALETLLNSNMLNLSEREKTRRYLEAVHQLEKQYKKKSSLLTQLPHFEHKIQPTQFLERQTEMRPLEQSTVHEKKDLLREDSSQKHKKEDEYDLIVDDVIDKKNRRNLTIGGQVRQSESKSIRQLLNRRKQFLHLKQQEAEQKRRLKEQQRLQEEKRKRQEWMKKRLEEERIQEEEKKSKEKID